MWYRCAIKIGRLDCVSIFKSKSIATIQTVHAIRLIDRVLFGIVHTQWQITKLTHNIDFETVEADKYHPAKRQNCTSILYILVEFFFCCFRFIFVLTNNDISYILCVPLHYHQSWTRGVCIHLYSKHENKLVHWLAKCGERERNKKHCEKNMWNKDETQRFESQLPGLH